MSNCPYCAQADTRKDKHGYCKKHNCYETSGEAERVRKAVRMVDEIYSVPDRTV